MSTTPSAPSSEAPTGAAPAAPTSPAAPAAPTAPAVAAVTPAAPEAPEAPAAPVVPDKYELTLPEGVTALPEGFEARAKAAGFTAQQAQAALDGEFAARTAVAKEHDAAFQSAVKAWGEQVAADPEIGGANLEASKATAAKAIAEFGSPEMKQFLESTGFGNHPVVVRHFVQLGKLLDAGKFVKGDAPKRPTDLASRMYPPKQ